MRKIHRPSPEQGTCWACGMWRWCVLGYCRECTLSGLDNPMINCSSCGACKRRQLPGQQTFTCPTCRKERAA